MCYNTLCILWAVHISAYRSAHLRLNIRPHDHRTTERTELMNQENKTSEGFADIHCHMLAGVDDGAQTIEEMIEMARLAHEDGITAVCFTPHSGKRGKDSDPNLIKKAFAVSSQLLTERFPDMSFYLGNELYYSSDIPSKIKSGQYFSVNGGKYVLVEFFPGTDLFNIESGIRFIRMAGFVPILAHTERYACVFKSEETLTRLRKNETVIQVNCDCILKSGLIWRHRVKKLLRCGLIDLVASDSHDAVQRIPRMSQCYKQIALYTDREYADILTRKNPRLILEGKAIIR